ncbi:alpha/beta hydrolase [Azospirillum sp. TSO35-2]|nr:alpha/beta hydrolase [Azospirillum sp. TSO35-2]
MTAVPAAAAPAWADADPAVGFRRLSLPETGGHRALEGAVWYPTDDSGGAVTLVGDTRALVGAAVRVGAVPRPGRHPLVVLSHGYGGNWTNQQWLAVDLAARGYIVAAANHPGSTSRDMAPPGAATLWKRPGDVSHLIDALSDDPQWSGLLVPRSAAVVGHSLGGWTAVALAGGRFDQRRFDMACRAHPEMAACGPGIGATGADADADGALARSLADERVRAVVTLDLGLVQGFDPVSLAAIRVPVLVIAAGPGDPKMPVELESRALADRLPAGSTRYAAITDAGHFSFLSVCKADAIPLLEAERPGDGMICRDGQEAGRDRTILHRQVSGLVAGFLSDVLPTP